MIPAARLPGSQRMRSTPVGPTSSVATAASALVRIGAAAKYPSVRRAASASRRRSMARGASPTGGAALAAFAAAATLAWPSGPLSQIAASNASRYVSRERLGFSDSSWVAALSSKRAASAPRRWSNAICPWRCSAKARRRSDGAWASTAGRSASAASRAPASRFAAAADNVRSARRPGSVVNSAARSRSADAARGPPRDLARSAERSSSSAAC